MCAFSASLVGEVDVPEENIATMLTYLELSPARSWIKVKQPVNATCFIQCYGGAAHLTALAKQVITIFQSLQLIYRCIMFILILILSPDVALLLLVTA